MGHDTIPHRLRKQAKNRPDAVAFHQKGGDIYETVSWSAYARAVERAGKALIALGLEPGGTVALLGYNRPEWPIFHVAAMSVGGAGAGIYTTSSPEEVRYIVHHAESAVVLVENEAQWAKIERELPNLPLLRHVVTMRGAPAIDHPMVLPWDRFLAKGDTVSDLRFSERLEALEPQGLATLIYTSGTTGPPKGVMLSHRNLTFTADAQGAFSSATVADSYLSYLPLSHAAEQILSIHGHISCGYQVHFAESIERVPDNLREVQPTLVFGVPRIWEKMHAGIQDKLATAPRARRALVDAAMRVGRDYHAAKNAGRDPGLFLRIAHGIFGLLVYSKVKRALGLRRARLCASGAAPITPAIIEFLTGLDVMIYEVYGQSEDTGPTSITRPGNAKIGTVGPPFPGVEVRFAEDGEILVRGPNVFLGYLKEPAATAEVLVDGWLHTGDLGKLDADGNLVITGRKKEIIITAGGKNITPKNIESALKEHPLIGEAVVIGDRRKYLTVLLTLDPAALDRFTSEKGVAKDGPEVHAELQRAIDEVNGRLARVETIKKFTVLPRPFSIETGELTPTLKVKRRVVHDKYAREIDAMYEGEHD